MLLDIPSVASMEGAVTSITWNKEGVYAYGWKTRVPGAFLSGTFTDGEDVAQILAPWGGSADGAQSTGDYLALTGIAGENASKTEPYIGNVSSAVFEPTGLPYLDPGAFIYVDPPYDAKPYIVLSGDLTFTADPGNITLLKNPRQGSVLKLLKCKPATFTVPQWAKSFSLKNISGSVAYFRQYRPNVEANVIDTVAKTFGEANIVGQQLADGQVVSFSAGDFTQCASFAMCAAASATSGAIVDFYA